MPLSAGDRLGPYEIIALIGSGGMGEVYRARDTKLKRDVALKVLPQTVAGDPDRMARFQREAEVLAALNHPNIAAIYGVEERALVMELVEGETLSGPVPLGTALGYARQIAEALEAAHEKGIIHRDLKPGNVMITPAGAVKVLDFGLAAVPSREPSTDPRSSPTMTMAATQAGMIMGTAAYMSPEQAAGKTVDKRTDLWALGVILMEMLTGRQVFDGETVSHVLAAVLTREPDWSVLPAHTPVPVRKLLRRLLEKDRKRRLADAGDLRLEIEDVLTAPGPVESSRRAVALPFASALVAGGALIGALAVGLWTLRSPRTDAASLATTRLLMSLHPAESLLGGPGTNLQQRPTRTSFAWTPDGRALVFSAIRGGVQQLYVRQTDELEARPLPDTEGAVAPFLSPDGRWVGFWANGELKKVPAAGGPAVTIAKARTIFGATWSEQDTIFFDQPSMEGGGIWRVAASGGRAEIVASPDPARGEHSYRLPQALPGSKALLFTVTSAVQRTSNAQIVIRSLDTGRQQVITDGADARYIAPGYLIFMRAGTLLAAPFDLNKRALTGGAVGLLDGVMQSVQGPNRQLDVGAGQFSVSSIGALAYVPGSVFAEDLRPVVWVDRAGAVTPVAMPPRMYWAPRLAPDGKKLAVYSRGPEGRVWIHDLRTGITTPLTDPGGTSAFPVWTRDNARVTFADGNLPNLFWRTADGSGAAERLTTSKFAQAPGAWSPDGARLAFVQSVPASGAHIWMLEIRDGRATARQWLNTRYRESFPDWSPDGSWLVYSSDESGRDEVYIQPYPGPGPRYEISNSGGDSPVWSRDGREIFYVLRTGLAADGRPRVAMMAAPVTLHPSVSVGTPRKLFEGEFWLSGFGRGFDVTADGRRFVMVQAQAQTSPAPPVSEIVIVGNWLQELNRLVPR